MIENRLVEALMKMGYSRVNANVNGINIAYIVVDEEAYIVTVVHALTGEEFTWAQYDNILAQIKDNFMKRSFRQIHLLSIICTQDPDKVKQFCADRDNYWIIDTSTNRLIIYENQSSSFRDLKNVIEHLFEEPMNKDSNMQGDFSQEYSQGSGQTSAHHDYMKKSRGANFGNLTLCNSILIGINVIVFLVVQFSGWFGGAEEIKYNGALSWFSVRDDREYYRILSSMFLHSDINHLFNNMLVLLFVGDKLERATGKMKYLFIYFGTGILAGISSMGYNMMKDSMVVSIGASGAIFGLVGAMIYILIVNKGHLEDINMRQIALFVIFSLYGGITSVNIDNAAHIGGFLAGIILAVILYRRPKQIPDRIR